MATSGQTGAEAVLEGPEARRSVSLADELRARIEQRAARVAVVGLGCVGLPLARLFAAAGFPVTGLDVDPEKISNLKASVSYLGTGPPERLAALGGLGRLTPASDPCALAPADAIVICVPTPLTHRGEPDLSCVTGAAETLSRHLRPGQLVVLESTTYPGTTEDLLRPILERSGLRAGRDFFLAFSPERGDPGNPAYPIPAIPKVVGGLDATSRHLALALYAAVVTDVVPVSNVRVAEACKLLENTYRAVNIALVNELKVAFERLGIDVWEVIAAARTKPFGLQVFLPGPGVGGNCIPVNPSYLAWAARRAGAPTRLVELAGEVNAAMPGYVVERVGEALHAEGKAVSRSRILVLGVAYKRDVDDARGSAALEIIERLRVLGGRVGYNDPHVPVLPPGLQSQPLTEDLLAAQDCVVIVTDHSAYDFGWVVRHARLVVDTRNATAAVSVDAAGCRVWKA